MSKVVQYHEQSDLPLEESEIELLIREVLSFKKIDFNEIIFHFVTKEAISHIHGDFFNDPSPTDCITFPIDPIDCHDENRILGEIFVCPKVAMEYDKENPYWETTLYIVHGILHLLGYDDIDESDRVLMRAAESEVMTFLEDKNLVLTAAQSFVSN